MAKRSDRRHLVHELNNALTAISGYAEYVLARLPDDHPLRKQVAEIRNAGHRAAQAARGLDER